MGVTIHFSGQVNGQENLGRVLAEAAAYAASLGWSAQSCDCEHKLLRRVVDEQDVDYEGPVRGLVIHAHDWAEPIWLEFDSQGAVQDWVKTQFAPIEVHKNIVTLLRRVAGHFETLSVYDEGEYFETADEAVLARHRDTIEATITRMRAENPSSRGPVKLESGRIADLLT